LEAQALADREQAVAQAVGYLDGTAPFPERIHILGLFGKFTLDHTALLIEWARWARAEVEQWPDVGTAEVSPEVVRAFEAAVAERAVLKSSAGGGSGR
jgi:hypothetical protein